MSEAIRVQNDTKTAVGIGTLARFLVGDQEAILAIASAPGALGIGALFVLSAAFAREYDGVDLLAEPWHLAIPFVASLGTSFLLFCLLYNAGESCGMGAVPFGRSYLKFLRLYWLTAPLAWLYAIPVERFLTPLGATQSNLALLGLVSLWRVGLIIRAAQVLFGASPAAVGSLVLAFADAVALAAIYFMPKPVISLMGGISHTDSEMMILDVTYLTGFVCLVGFPILLTAATAMVVPRKTKWQFVVTDETPRLHPTRSLRALAIASVAAWLFVLPLTQPQQRLASRVDRDLKAGKIAEAVQIMAAHERSDFPARWDPPPHVGYGDRIPPIVDVMETVLAEKPPAWVSAIFTEKFGNIVFDRELMWPGGVDDKEFGRYVDVLLKLPEGPSIAARQQHWLRFSHDLSNQSEVRRADIQALLDLAKTYDSEKSPALRATRSR